MSDQAVLLPKWSQMGESFWQNTSLVTHILFELFLFWYLVQSTPSICVNVQYIFYFLSQTVWPALFHTLKIFPCAIFNFLFLIHGRENLDRFLKLRLKCRIRSLEIYICAYLFRRAFSLKTLTFRAKRKVT